MGISLRTLQAPCPCLLSPPPLPHPFSPPAAGVCVFTLFSTPTPPPPPFYRTQLVLRLDTGAASLQYYTDTGASTKLPFVCELDVATRLVPSGTTRDSGRVRGAHTRTHTQPCTWTRVCVHVVVFVLSLCLCLRLRGLHLSWS
jgi:hypothetical protein